MAKAKKYTAEHQGFTFRRKSARTYTHAVAVRCSLAEQRKGCEQDARGAWRINFEYHQRAAVGQPAPGYSYAVTPEQQAQSKAMLELGVEGYVAQRLAVFDERARGVSTLADGVTYFVCAGWCGRYDLAVKLANAEGGVIIEARAERPPARR